MVYSLSLMSGKLRLKIQENVILAPLTTMKIGGAARFFLQAATEEDISEAVKFADENELNLFILGGGSNVLISDKGFDGLVLQIGLRGIEFKEDIVVTKAGEDWDDFVKLCVDKNLQGIECLSGIPGLVGGTPVQNVGAYSQEVSETIQKVRVFDRKSKEFLELTNADCKFAYRTSIFNTIEKNRFIVLEVTYKLIPNGTPKIAYKDLKEFFGDKNPTLAETREAVIAIRRAKSMVIDELDENSKSAGSFFKNPLISNEKLAEIIENTGLEDIPSFKTNGNFVKISAAWLIEQSGFQKGFRQDKIGISTKHTLAIVNFENGRAEDVISLKNLIQTKVKEKFGIELQPEPIFIGF